MFKPKPFDVDKITADFKFYIYGAGMVGSAFYHFMKQKFDLDPISFVVTNTNDPSKKLFDIPIQSIDNIEDKKAVFIIATMSNAHNSIFNELEIRNFETAYFITDEMYQDFQGYKDPKYVKNLKYWNAQKIRISEMLPSRHYTSKKMLVVSDNLHSVNEKNPLDRFCNAKIVKTDEYITNMNKYNDEECIMCLSVNWTIDLFEKLMSVLINSRKELLLSIKSRSMFIGKFDFLRAIKLNGYQITSYKYYSRSETDDEYDDSEDLLIHLEHRTPFTLCRDKLCMGCGKCELDCPVGAIQLNYDENYNYKPFVDPDKCINCGKCVKQCPVYTSFNNVRRVDIVKRSDLPDCYAFMASDEMRKKSSSGGAFGVLAEKFLDDGGYICGAAWNADFSVSHILIDNKADLHKLQLSKYLKSDIMAVLPEIKRLSSEGKKILFSGCPCQVAALKAYLNGKMENILLIDIVCTQAPPDAFFKKYISENFDLNNLKEYGFRIKTYGWSAKTFYYVNKNNETNIQHGNDAWQNAYHPRIMQTIHCEHCAFSGIPRVGDITIGDFWGIENTDPTMHDTKGTSVILLNTEKGKAYLSELEEKALALKKEPFEYFSSHNRVGNGGKINIHRDRLYDEFRRIKFNHLIDSTLNNKFDIGLVGVWAAPNFGSHLTYYSLYKILKNMGYSVCMLEWSEDSKSLPGGCAHLFQKIPYHYYEVPKSPRHRYEMKKFNDMCDIFIHGSDQLLNPYIYRDLRTINFDWTDLSKKKIAYALSFGLRVLEYSPKERKELTMALKQYSSISVREDTAVDLIKYFFGVDAVQLLDPVFLSSKDDYLSIADNNSGRNYEEDYILAYMLDQNNELGKIVAGVAKKRGLHLKLIMDARYNDFPDQLQTFADMFGKDVELLNPLSVEEFLYAYSRAKYVFTDSMHGSCFAMIFQKDFNSYANNRRGIPRFESLLKMLGLMDRLSYSVDEVKEREDTLFSPVPYDKINLILNDKKQKSMNWLKEALTSQVQPDLINELMIMTDKYNKLISQIKHF